MYPSLGFNKVYELEKKIPGCFGEDFKHDDLFRLSHHCVIVRVTQPLADTPVFKFLNCYEKLQVSGRFYF